jgi:hypothetical protein
VRTKQFVVLRRQLREERIAIRRLGHHVILNLPPRPQVQFAAAGGPPLAFMRSPIIALRTGAIVSLDGESIAAAGEVGKNQSAREEGHDHLSQLVGWGFISPAREER